MTAMPYLKQFRSRIPVKPAISGNSVMVLAPGRSEGRHKWVIGAPYFASMARDASCAGPADSVRRASCQQVVFHTDRDRLAAAISARGCVAAERAIIVVQARDAVKNSWRPHPNSLGLSLRPMRSQMLFDSIGELLLRKRGRQCSVEPLGLRRRTDRLICAGASGEYARKTDAQPVRRCVNIAKVQAASWIGS